jgi:hypothetical protein
MCVCPLALRIRAHLCESTSANLPRPPFLDSHLVFSAPNDVAIRAFDRAEAETTPSEVTGGLTSTFIRHFRYGLIAHAEGPVIPGLHGQDASLPDMLVNGSRIVLVDVDDSADRGEMFSPFPLFPRA